MNRRAIILCAGILTALLAGFWAGNYVAAVGFRYREAYFSISGGLVRLHLLERGWTDKIRDEAEVSIIGGCVVIDRLPGWACHYSPDHSSAPVPAAWVENVRKLKLVESNRFYMSQYGLSDSDIDRILRTHFHWSNSKNEKTERNTEPRDRREPP